MRPFAEIDDFFEPGQTLADELADDALAADLRHQHEVLSALSARRLRRAYDEAEIEALGQGLAEPTQAMVLELVQFFERQEMDLPPDEV